MGETTRTPNRKRNQIILIFKLHDVVFKSFSKKKKKPFELMNTFSKAVVCRINVQSFSLLYVLQIKYVLKSSKSFPYTYNEHVKKESKGESLIQSNFKKVKEIKLLRINLRR